MNKTLPEDHADAADKKVVKLELVSPETAETEKLIGLNLKTMRLSANGHKRSESLQYAYAAIFGAAANRLAELVPARGGLEKLLEEKFADVSKSQLHVWRNFAKDLQPHLAISPMVGLIAAPVIGKKMPIPAKKLEGFQEAVKKVLRGATMVEFHKASQFAGEVAEPGGDRGGAGKKHRITAEEQAANCTAQIGRDAQYLRDCQAREIELKLCSLAALNELDEERLKLGRKIEEIRALRKVPTNNTNDTNRKRPPTH